MDAAELGRRIKEARIAKKMTQSEVVGNFITRNMLSQIESGTATPSMKTLAYLGDVLNLPLSALMPDDDSNSPLVRLAEIKQCLNEKQFEKVLMLAESGDSALQDEYHAILAKAYLGLAVAYKKDGIIQKAAEYAEKAAEYADYGIYANKGLKTEGILLLHSLAEQLKVYYADKIEQYHDETESFY